MERSCSAQAEFGRMAATFKCISDPSRLKLLAIVLDGETNVGKLAAQCGLSPSATSHHLRVLRNLRFVSASREGQQVNYRINDEHIRDLMEQAYKHSLHLLSSELRDK